MKRYTKLLAVFLAGAMILSSCGNAHDDRGRDRDGDYFEVNEYDQNGNFVTGAGYHADGSCWEGPKCDATGNAGSVCEFYPTLDFCNN